MYEENSCDGVIFYRSVKPSTLSGMREKEDIFTQAYKLYVFPVYSEQSVLW